MTTAFCQGKIQGGVITIQVPLSQISMKELFDFYDKGNKIEVDFELGIATITQKTH